LAIQERNALKKGKANKLKIINDPIYGFIQISNPIVFDIIEHPYFQRLRRITQMGFSNLVYPGANHTRFHHAIGCMYLMQKVVRVLRFKEIEISKEEENALYLAILLHDIGHGAFSHALEHSIVQDITHEEISLLFMKKLNEEFDGKLSLAIAIFEGKYERNFMNQLISSQLDIDRLDYLNRDSFYTGVTEGNIASDRLITMMNVKNDQLVIEQKGIYSVEKFLISRRLMYWQVYLHKTGLVAEHLLVKVLQRAKELVQNGKVLFGSSTLLFFLKHSIGKDNFDSEVLDKFSKLDDFDILSAIKEWCHHDDFILSSLSKRLIDRRLFKIDIHKNPISEEKIGKLKSKVLEKHPGINQDNLHYFVLSGQIENRAYADHNPIMILNKQGKLLELTKASDHFNLKALEKPVIKYFLCYPKLP
tara:strand:+ start:223759 stop:225015 length:1257 start_codon:yes stop_codon:yes gene_type:complete